MNRIKMLRIQNKLTQKQLCKILNIAQPTLSGYETDNFQPDNNTLFKIADYFGETIDYVLGREGPKNRMSLMRQVKGLSFKQIAETLNIDEPTYIDIESEFFPIKDEQLNELCSFYRVEKIRFQYLYMWVHQY